MAKTRKKKRARKKKKKAGLPPEAIKAALAALVIALLFWGLLALSEGRHWRAFYEAGEGAHELRNFEYAEKMYLKALKEAKRLDPDGDLTIRTLNTLAELYDDQGRTDAARYKRQEAQSLGR